jgi:hypothetical protein
MFPRNTEIRLRSDEASHPRITESSTSTYQKVTIDYHNPQDLAIEFGHLQEDI